ncbi:sigma-70 family RNA polymerase sigma factor [Micromonospora sp. NPDC048063]|uniref:sigma-70 family RNA polymerase sigma factor n=1 Tax=Micromonospora sp. NPDC048063 TaxID=3364256 RepID=UPI003716D964
MTRATAGCRTVARAGRVRSAAARGTRARGAPGTSCGRRDVGRDRAGHPGGGAGGRRAARRDRRGGAVDVVGATPGGPPVTAVVTAPARIPAQAGPPAAEQISDARRRWDLVDAAAGGDRQAFGRLYEMYRDTVFRFVYFRCGNRQLAEDLTADTFVRALRRIDQVSWQGSDIGAWFVTIARNLVADYFKSSRYQREVAVGDILDGEDRVDHTREGDPAGAAVAYLSSRDLLAAVKQLNPEQQECIVLRFLQGYSVRETAVAMGKQEGAIKALQYRAVRALARLLPPGIEVPA